MPFKIYYVDDESDLTELFTEIFARDDREIVTFTDPAEALAHVAIDPPDLIFIDYQLPTLTGLELAARLDPALPKALITGNLSLETGDLFAAVFSKPMDVAEVERFIEGSIARR